VTVTPIAGHAIQLDLDEGQAVSLVEQFRTTSSSGLLRIVYEFPDGAHETWLQRQHIVSLDVAT
jgi:hypothetical protein